MCEANVQKRRIEGEIYNSERQDKSRYRSFPMEIDLIISVSGRVAAAAVDVDGNRANGLFDCNDICMPDPMRCSTNYASELHDSLQSADGALP